MDEGIWYDGSGRSRHEAVARITADARAFLKGRTEAFASDSSAWAGLVEQTVGTALFRGSDRLDPEVYEAAPTIAWTVRVSVLPDRALGIAVDARWFPRRRAAIIAALSRAPWCASVREGPPVEVTTRPLDLETRRRLASAIRAAAERTRDRMRNGAAAFAAMVEDEVLDVNDALTQALAEVDELEAAKLEALTS